MNKLIQQFNQVVNSPDLAKLFLRVGFAGMFLFHGIFKAVHTESITHVGEIFAKYGLPSFFAEGIYLGQILAPILIIIGLYTRISAFICTMTSVVIILLIHNSDFFSLTKFGGWAVESIGTFFFAFLAIMLLGSGKFAVKPD